MKKFSVRLPRTLQRGAPLVNAGLSDAIQTALDVATADRCDIVENFVVRPRKAWFALLVIASQNSSTRCNLRAHADFPTVFLVWRSSFKLVVTSFGNGQRKCAGWNVVELREFRVQQKNCGRVELGCVLLVLFVRQEKTIRWNITGGNISLLTLVSNDTWASSVAHGRAGESVPSHQTSGQKAV